MKWKTRIVAVVSTAVLVAVVGIVGFALTNYTVSYECSTSFGYKEGEPQTFSALYGNDTSSIIRHNIQDRYRSLVFMMSDRLYFPFAFDKMVYRCLSDPRLKGDGEDRVRAVLSSMRFEVVGMPSTNFVYPCRLVITDQENRNLGEYARLCMAMFKERLNEEENVRADKAVLYEHEQMLKTERRITELENTVSSGNSDSSVVEELHRARKTVHELQRRMEKKREEVMSRNARRIIQESQPEISWVVRRKPRKEKAP